MTAWAFIPARGGSKSIKKKNIALVNGVPLLDYTARAAKAAGMFERIVCSTDDDEIAQRARHNGIAVDNRPAELATDNAQVTPCVREYLERAAKTAELPDHLALIQPTSPFLLAEHIVALLDALKARPEGRSAQNVTPVPHNHHAINQRKVEDGLVRFASPEERRIAHNKQLKPARFVFGNFLIATVASLLAGGDFFTEPSVAVTVPRPYDFDLDGPDDLVIAEALLQSGKLHLPHMKGA